MVMKRGKIGDGPYRAYKIGKQVESIDRAYAGLLDTSFDLEKVDKDFDISPLGGYERKDYWRILNLKKRHENGLKNLSKQVKSFVGDYMANPILSFDGNEESGTYGQLKTGYEGRKRGHMVKGCFRFHLWHPEWFLGLTLPKPPRRLTEVFG